MSQAVTKTAETFTAYQVSMANAPEIVQLLITLMADIPGFSFEATGVIVNNAPAYEITIRQPGYIDQLANIEDYIVTGRIGPAGPVVEVWQQAAYGANFTATATS